MKRAKGIYWPLVVSILLSICVDQAAAETFGPYFYRTGDEESYVRWETTIHLNSGELVVNECGEPMHLLESQTPRQCWIEKYEQGSFSADKMTIQFVGGDVAMVDRRTRRFNLQDRLDHRDIVRNVPEHFDGWENTPASWQLR